MRKQWGIGKYALGANVVFNEDSNKTRKDHGAENLALLRKFAFNILRNIEIDKTISALRKRSKAMTDKAFLNLVVNNTFLV